MTAQRTHADERTDATGVSVVIPTYNERENVAPMVRSCRRALAEYDAEVIVVDDDSPDGTWRRVDREFGDADDVRLVRRVDDQGLATAVVEGFDASRNEHLGVIDGDFQHPPGRLPDLVDALQTFRADVAVGSRYLAHGGIEEWSSGRKALSYGATLMTRTLVPDARRLSDPLSGFFAVRRDLVDDVSLSPTGYKILLEILTKCSVDRIAEVPFTFSDRDSGESKATVDEYAKFLNHLVSCSYRTRIHDDGRPADPVALTPEFER